MYGRSPTPITLAFRGGLWHNGRSVQYNGEDLIGASEATVYGACLTRFGTNWYLHYVTINGGSPIHRLWQAPFDRDTHFVYGMQCEADRAIAAISDCSRVHPFKHRHGPDMEQTP